VRGDWLGSPGFSFFLARGVRGLTALYWWIFFKLCCVISSLPEIFFKFVKLLRVSDRTISGRTISGKNTHIRLDNIREDNIR
jgi:hypothetical protein